MEKITALTSADIVADNIQLLKQLFPTIVKEDKIDLNELKALLGESVEEKEEYYRFIWAGKNQARLEANKPTTATLRPNKKDSKDWDTTGNIFIEGDNLEVLKLLQKSYANKIKMIYIDPPYNTGNDFVYEDDYSDNLGNYLRQTKQIDESGKKTSTNTESDGRYHSKWLNLMYPRLRLARNLLKDDGVIFISIDDHEVDNLVKIGKEIFGEENYLATFTWVKKKKGSHLSKTHRSMTEYVIVFGKKISNLELYGEAAYSDKWQPIVKRTNAIKELIFPANIVTTNLADGKYDKIKYSNTTSTVKFLQPFEVKQGLVITELKTEAAYVWTQRKLDEEISLGSSVSLSRQFGFNVLRHNQDEKIKRPSTLLDSKSEIGTNEDSYNEAIELFKQEGIMDYPKPTSLMKYLCRSGTFYETDSIILDFFAGSGTTAHAVMQLNAEDEGNRKCISVQLPEPTDEKSEAFKAGYATIAEITKERIRRAGEKIKQDFKDKEGIEKLDIGFKAFKLDSSNIVAWDGNPDNLAEQLDAFANNIKTDRTEEDILFEILLKYGLDLTVAIEEKTIAQQKVYSVGLGTLFICLSNNITPEVSEGIGAWKQELNPTRCRVIFKDTGFASDKDKVNAMQILKRFGVEEVNSI
ncbi:site-specific DNA-methyltransferase [Flavobacterium filum]|uniref:site-specific DNA-methyltransferase n=1 Tax=Flavobacterium filum TaxID=370974 RepID=UPI000416EE0E|nr:site-specific DNA-methyltransferase [Flavobacterium filum]